MTVPPIIAWFSPLDYVAFAFALLGALWIGWRIEHPKPDKPSVSILMEGFRRDWMHQMVRRDPRVFDGQLISNLRQGTAFFASAAMIALGGGFAVIGNTDQLADVVGDLTLGRAPAMVWEFKLLVVLAFLANAFLKFVWAHRLFGYCSVLMAAVPNDPAAPLAHPRAAQAADISITAARSFNRAMRATYFSLASVAWLLGPVALMIASGLTIAVLYRREFASRSRTVLLRVPADPGPMQPDEQPERTR
ncbi:DUF599 domain-containing protein [Sedimentitalea arenosa]|jgi:uncharacterized membrane protein|uniref:DUF599 domain-containing protein n=1 Tax=Sedimentitalea arenosa TaxID=2798803 RepID=A0A8J7JHA3_9RHOB|nr:DUF599 domain-containing protein [Arenibacterium arenosum]MBJ6372139.1 DUF599 domain-containing protein [Arenibacterium arenosum]